MIDTISWNGSGWIKGNVGQKGFYRVNYDNKNWDALADALKSDHKVRIQLHVSSINNCIGCHGNKACTHKVPHDVYVSKALLLPHDVTFSSKEETNFTALYSVLSL